ncbi:MAG: putative glutamine amidotransferase [Kiritimatiellia bacterium]
MCRLFGFRSAAESGAHASLLEAENALRAQSTKHPDGWGIGWFTDGEAYVVKSGATAHSCERFEHASRRLTSETFLVHVRRATVGVVDHLNAHPFRLGRWLFAHNGTIFGMDQLGPWLAARTHEGLARLVLGDTDSERLFYYLLTAMANAGLDHTGRRPSNAAALRSVVREALMDLDREATVLGLERPILNVLLTDGREFLGHRAGMPLFLSTQKLRCSDFDTCQAIKICMEHTRPSSGKVNHMLLASEPIAISDNVWEELDDGTTVVLTGDFTMEMQGPPPHWIAPVLPERYRSA